jgi:hypothetical protein
VRQEIRINDHQAVLFHDEDNSAVIWEMGDYTLDLFTALSPEETIKIAENIRLKEAENQH